jgi:hypothetical protein
MCIVKMVTHGHYRHLLYTSKKYRRNYFAKRFVTKTLAPMEEPLLLRS